MNETYEWCLQLTAAWPRGEDKESPSHLILVISHFLSAIPFISGATQPGRPSYTCLQPQTSVTPENVNMWEQGSSTREAIRILSGDSSTERLITKTGFNLISMKIILLLSNDVVMEVQNKNRGKARFQIHCNLIEAT